MHATGILSINCQGPETLIPPWIIQGLDPKWSNGEGEVISSDIVG